MIPVSTLILALAALAAGAHAIAPSAQEPSAAGRWKTVNERGETKSVVVIENVGTEWKGRVDKIFAPPARDANPHCERCPGDKKDKAILGMEIMWGFKRSGAEYTGGRILDPEDGKVYKCKLKVIDGGKKLEVRGYVGISLIGRTQTWVRAE